ncbi:MAG: transposase [Paludibacteraceae bacterium]
MFLKKHHRIPFIFLPPYLPNFNIIERLWHIKKKNVVYNRLYQKFSEIQVQVLAISENKTRNNSKRKNFLTDNFQIKVPDFSASFVN